MLLRLEEQLIQKQKDNSEFGGLYHYLEDSGGISGINEGMFEKWFWSFQLIYALFFPYRAINSRGKLGFDIHASPYNTILEDFRDNPLAGHLDIFKNYARICYSCYFFKMRETVLKSVSRCKSVSTNDLIIVILVKLAN